MRQSACGSLSYVACRISGATLLGKGENFEVGPKGMLKISPQTGVACPVFRLVVSDVDEKTTKLLHQLDLPENSTLFLESFRIATFPPPERDESAPPRTRKSVLCQPDRRLAKVHDKTLHATFKPGDSIMSRLLKRCIAGPVVVFDSITGDDCSGAIAAMLAMHIYRSAKRF